MINDSEFLHLLMDHMPNIVFIKDENSIILYANKAMLDVYPPERRDRIVGHTTVEAFDPEHARLFLAEDKRAIESDTMTEIVEESVSYTGQRRVYLTRKIGFTTPEGKRRLLGISSDITELSERERALVEMNSRLQAFSAVAAHDLRSPLSSFVTALEMVKLDPATRLGPQSARYVDMMISGATSLVDNIGGLLAVSKAVNARDSMSFAAFDLNMMIAEIRFTLAKQIEDSGARIHAARLPRLLVDGRMFRQLLQNLIENSIKYRSDERPLQIVVRHERIDGRQIVSITDNGSGISAAAAGRAFDMYEQEAGKGVNGVGIGLALCKRIVDLHDGRISIDADYQDGCRILIDLPEAAGVLD